MTIYAVYAENQSKDMETTQSQCVQEDAVKNAAWN